jgi:hypothetical protein
MEKLRFEDPKVSFDFFGQKTAGHFKLKFETKFFN